MNAFIFTAPIVAGVVLIALEMRITAHTFMSMLGYKLIPFAAGLGSIFAGLKLWGAF